MKPGLHDRNDGIGRMIRDLEDLSDSLSPANVRRKLDPLTAELTEELRAAMPVRTGALAASGHWTAEASAGHYEATVTFGGALAPYAPYVVGRGVNGVHPWDAVLPAHEERFEEAIHDLWDSAMRR